MFGAKALNNAPCQLMGRRSPTNPRSSKCSHGSEDRKSCTEYGDCSYDSIYCSRHQKVQPVLILTDS